MADKTVVWTDIFRKNFEKVLDSYPRSREDTRELIDNLPTTHQKGDIYPGINPQARKIRFPLKNYKIGVSGGLRLIFMVMEQCFLPILLYAKKALDKESVVKKSIITAQSEILAELRATNATDGKEQNTP